MKKQHDDAGIWSLMAIVFIIGTFVSMVIGGVTNTSSTPTQMFSPDTGSFEHRYVKERVKLEGYSDKEASQAADAIMKFHNAQQARKK
jgi:hypothetical protein